MFKGASPFVERVAEYVFERFRKELPQAVVYHDFNHTLDTAKAARELAKGYELSEEDMEDLLVAAFLHDLGYTETYDEHEEAGARLAAEYLKDEGMAGERIERIRSLILATKMPQSPRNRLEEILCDADLSSLGKTSHPEKTQLLRTEWEMLDRKHFTDEAWQKYDYEFLAGHNFHTVRANVLWGLQKTKNMLRVRQEIARIERRKRELEAKLSVKKKDLKRKEVKAGLPERGIETMFRTATRTHINLSAIADNKANIMLSINALIVSVVISGLAPKLDANPILILPTIVLLVVCVVSIIFATLSTRPSITKGRFSREDIRNKRSNLLFFGNFFNMKLEDYEWGMSEMMKDRDFLYGSLTRDLYYLGVVLARKYRFLRLTYTVFMWGVIISVVCFAATFYAQYRAAGQVTATP